MALEWDHPDPFTLDLTVTAADVDALNHTNNAVYVHWMDRVNWGHSVSLGVDFDCFRSTGRALVVAHSELSYLAPSFEGEQLRLGTWIVKCDGRLRLDRYTQVIRIGDARTLLRATVNYVCVDLHSGKPRRMPREFSDAYVPAQITER